MKSLFAVTVVSAALLASCSKQNAPAPQTVDAAFYQVKDVQALELKITALNQGLVKSYQQMKLENSYAFSDNSALNADDLKTLNVQAVSATALKPVKEKYCAVMNGYFNELYRLGHFNLALIDQVKLGTEAGKALKPKFENADVFYQYILEEHTTYKQAQQLMGYGCNLRSVLTPDA